MPIPVCSGTSAEMEFLEVVSYMNGQTWSPRASRIDGCTALRIKTVVIIPNPGPSLISSLKDLLLPALINMNYLSSLTATPALDVFFIGSVVMGNNGFNNFNNCNLSLRVVTQGGFIFPTGELDSVSNNPLGFDFSSRNTCLLNSISATTSNGSSNIRLSMDGWILLVKP